jgi:two-component system, NtrC family, nitrogen regulation sensor histidine kinase NtrY
MNILKKAIQNRALFHFLAGTILILCAILLQEYFCQQNDPKKIKANFINVLEAKEKILSFNFAKLKSVDHLMPDSLKIVTVKEFQKLFEEENIALFKFSGDSLVFWSTNAIPLSDIFYLKNKPSREIKKLQNGWFEIERETDSSGSYIGLILLQHQYPFQNDFLKNSFQEDFPVPDGTNIITCQEGDCLKIQNKIFPIDLRFPEKIILPGEKIFFLFLLYFAGFLLLLASLYFLYKRMELIFRWKWLLVSAIVIDVLFLRFLIFYFRIPAVIYDSPLFGPTYFSSSKMLPSLGDFLVNSILLLFISYILFRNIPDSFSFGGGKKQFRIMVMGIKVMVVFTGLILCIAMIRELVINSTIPLTLQNISSLSFYSFLGFIIISAVFISFLLIAIRLTGFYSAKNFGIALVLLAVFATIYLNHYNGRQEKEKRKLLAIKLSLERDPLAEMLFSKQEANLLNDPFLQSYGRQNSSMGSDLADDSIASYMLKKYFRESWNNYTVQITICHKKKTLRIQPQNYVVNCESYFQDILSDFGKPVSGQHLFFLDYGYGFRNYMAVIPFSDLKDKANDKVTAFIEINSKLLFKDIGYPELLIDKREADFPDISGYSYAFFRNGKLIHRVGNIDYSLDLDHTLTHKDKEAHFYIKNGLDNYCYPIDKNNFLIITKKAGSLLDSIAPFSYLFFLFVFASLVFFLIARFPSAFKLSQIRFSERLQLSMIGILITSLLIVGFLVVFYITRLNHDKNIENLSERAHSISVELQHKLGSDDDLESRGADYLNELMTKFSNVFFSDVNLYNPKGHLIATSRPEIFEKGLVSPLMNNVAYANLKYAHSSLFTHNEFIGSHTYSSAYLPFFNDRNKLLAYLNLPYFARQDDLKREISTFMMAFINIYVFLIIIGFFIALIISNYITRPLRLLTQRLGNLTLGTSNEKLEWKRNDEVGWLVEEYNKKIDELAKSADLLAQSERESAWREMARQIAHEIKNPLTPMKLSVQYLQKSWEDKSGDWEQRIRRFTATMIEQIDSLSFIASEFSDFARMPDPKNEKLELNEIINNSVALYKNLINISIDFSSMIPEAFVIADKKQLLRVFTNLFNNSIQAIGEEKKGLIHITLQTLKEKHIITITDNGSGISPDQAGKIFQPNFTTKSGGMGLGLAIVKNIILNCGGEIEFQSEPVKGTVFTITLPSAEQRQIQS